MRRIPSLHTSLLTALAAALCAATASASPLTVRAGPFPEQRGAAIEGDAVAVARALVGAQVELDAGRASAFTGGRRLVRFGQRHHGLPVYQRAATVTFDARGVAVSVATRFEDDLPADTEPLLGADEAVALAGLAGLAGASPPRAVLAIWPAPAGARLAWVVTWRAPTLPFAPLRAVDAKTGEVLARVNRVAFLNQAEVWPDNPVTSPDLVTVTLPVTAASTVLASPLVVARNCVDQQHVVTVESVAMHVCDPVHTATPDANGNYLPPAGKGDEPEDAFAEVAGFYHVSRAYSFFQGFDPTLHVQTAPLDVVTNVRLAAGYFDGDLARMKDPSLPLEPLQNAYFAPGDEPSLADYYGVAQGGVFFGQGKVRDFAYDGDVVYHELTHSVTHATVGFVRTLHLDAYGGTFAPAAMDEAIADYFSAAIVGDPDIGEYVVQDFAPEGAALRSLDDVLSCPADFGGEPHQDATAFSGALWVTRAALAPGDASKLDGAVLEALEAAPTGDLGFDDMATIVVGAVKSSLGAPIADALVGAFTERGLLPGCSRVRDFDGKTSVHGPAALGFFIVPGRVDLPGPSAYAPGVFQVRAAVPPGAERLRARFVGAAAPAALGYPDAAVALKILARFDGEPLRFATAPFGAEGDVVLVDTVSTGTDFSADLDVPAGATVVHWMVVNAGPGGALIDALQIGDATDTPPSSWRPPVRRPIEDDSGCALARGPGESAAAWLVALVAAAMGLRSSGTRRRARAARRSFHDARSDVGGRLPRPRGRSREGAVKAWPASRRPSS